MVMSRENFTCMTYVTWTWAWAWVSGASVCLRVKQVKPRNLAYVGIHPNLNTGTGIH